MNQPRQLDDDRMHALKAIFSASLQCKLTERFAIFRRGVLARSLHFILACWVLLLGSTAHDLTFAATTVDIANVPLLALKSAPGLVMMTMSRDHRLFYAAYDDATDLDGDGLADVGFKPNITYYGNFVSNRCYDYITSGANQPLFRPVALAVAGSCNSGTQRWHGNWLNWATTSRMDALRRVLYGGYRVVDNDTTSGNTSTVLQGAYIPNDSHVWGKEFRPGRDTYLITDYTTLATPTAGKQHLFVVISPTANTGYPFQSATVAPVLRHISNADMTTERIWYWASADVAQGIGKNPANFSKGGGRNSVAATDRVLRVEACVPISTVRETGCVGYPTASPTVWKPTGVLHDYSVNDSLKFGLITGSYQNNYSGGVVRRNIRSFKDEINTATGQFSDVSGIAQTIDRITIHGWSGSIYDCGYKTTANRNQGDCKSWGAPVGEMMYEGLRYFAGKTAATPIYVAGVSTGADNAMGFSAPVTWQNPYQSKTTSATYGNPICSRPVQMVIADPLTSFDSDQLPGSYFSTPTTGFGTALGSNDLTGLNVTTEVDTIWTAEGLGSRKVYIGQAGDISTYDGNPTPKAATGFSQLRGLAPDETQSQGSFYSAGVARFGQKTGVPIGAPTGIPAVPTVAGQKVDTLAIALGSRTPRIEFPNPNGGTVSIVPLSKAIYPANKNPGQYQATGAITGFYYASYSPTSVSAVVNFSDSDQGTDNETDAQVRYDISIAGNILTIQMVQLDPNPGGIQSNLGYVISGTGGNATTTKDGLYLDTRTNTGGAAQIYYLDTLATQDPKTLASPLNTVALPTYGTTTTRTFTLTAASGTGSFIPHDTLWYAAKYGRTGTDFDNNGDPTNYFKVTNPSLLPAQMGKAFRSAAALAAVASTSVVGVGNRSLGTAAVYQANYDSLTWSSRLYAFPVTSSVSNMPMWEASSLIPTAPASRTKLLLGRGGTTTPVQLNATAYGSLTSAERTDFGSASIYAYLLGDKSGEERNGGKLRNRGTTSKTDTSTPELTAKTYGSVLGDIVNSDPQVISKTDYGYTASDTTYTAFWNGITSEILAVGSNDGFFHVFDATPTSTGGGELLAFMPQAARTNIKDLSDPAYLHRPFVDGSIAQGHAKIRTPSDSTVKWRSVVVGAGGDGAQTVFAVDIPTTVNPITHLVPPMTAGNVMWEVNNVSGTDTTFGNIVGRPAIGKLANSGTWVAIFGNGYNSQAGTANLYVVRLNDGAVLQIIPTNSSYTGNGLGATEIVRKSSGDADTIDYVYGADYKGHIWRFDLSQLNSGLSNWSTALPTLVYTTPTGRPITAELKVGAAPSGPGVLTTGGKMIYFGTGSFLAATDPALTSVQALYGIYDDLYPGSNSSPSVSDASLSSMTITMVAGADTRQTSNASTPNWYTVANKKGWVVPLTGTNVTAGERVIAPPVRYTVPGLVDAILFTSIVPGLKECDAGLDAWITGVDAMTGGYVAVFNGLVANSVKVAGGSPRGVFVLSETGSNPALYISQTVFNNTISTTSYTTGSGGSQDVTINGVTGTTRIISVDLAKAPPIPTPTTNSKQVWRQLR